MNAFLTLEGDIHFNKISNTESCSLMGTSKHTTFLWTIRGIYQDFLIGNAPAGAPNTENLLRLCPLEEIAGGRFQVASWMGGLQYLSEFDCDVALSSLTVDSCVAFSNVSLSFYPWMD